MMSDWPLVTIDSIKADSKGSIAIGPFGSRMKSDCYVEDGIPVVRGTNITGGPTFEGNFVYITEDKADTLGSSNVYQNDLVFPHRGSIGEVGIILDDERFVLSSSLMKLTCDRERVNSKFLYYFFKSRIGRHELLKNASQVGTPGIGQPLTSLKSIEFRLPPLEIQNKIEEMLTSIDDKIELNSQTNQTLEQIAQAIFKSWFVDFEPVKAKAHVRASVAEGKLPGTNQDLPPNYDVEAAVERAAICAISGLSPDEGKTEEQLNFMDNTALQQLKTTAALFPDVLVESELGEVPEGWEVSKVDNIVKRLKPKKRYTKKLVESYGAVPVFEQGTDILLGYHNDEAGFLATSNEPLFIFGDHTCVMHLSCEPFDISQNVIPLSGDNYPTLWVYYAVKDKQEFQEYRRHWAEFIIKDVVIPSCELAVSYAELMTELYKRKESSVKENNTLSQIRDALLPKLLSGEIEITDAA